MTVPTKKKAKSKQKSTGRKRIIGKKAVTKKTVKKKLASKKATTKKETIVRKPLTYDEMWVQAVHYYIAGNSGYKSMILAGFTQSYARKMCGKVKRHPLFLELMGEAKEEVETARQYVLGKLKDFLDEYDPVYLAELCVTPVHSSGGVKPGSDMLLKEWHRNLKLYAEINGLLVTKIEQIPLLPVEYYLGSDNLSPEVAEYYANLGKKGKNKS